MKGVASRVACEKVSKAFSLKLHIIATRMKFMKLAR